MVSCTHCRCDSCPGLSAAGCELCQQRTLTFGPKGSRLFWGRVKCGSCYRPPGDIRRSPIAAATLDTTLVLAAHLHSVTRWVHRILELARVGSCISSMTIIGIPSRRNWKFAGLRTLFHDALSSSPQLCCAKVVLQQSGFSSHDNVSPCVNTSRFRRRHVVDRVGSKWRRLLLPAMQQPPCLMSDTEAIATSMQSRCNRCQI